MKKITMLALLFTAFGASQVKQGAEYFINELDADQDGTDTQEFIEIKTNPANTSLDGMVAVFFNGNNAVNGSYNVIDLDGFTTDGNGFLIIGDDAVPGVDIAIGASNKIQNGPDAVALYLATPADFPNGTPPSTTNLLAAIVYGKGEPDDVDLLMDLGETTQYNEDLNNNSEMESLQRMADGTYCTATTTLDLENNCTICEFVITATDSFCNTNTSGIDTTTVSLDFEGGGTETFITTLTTGTGIVGGDDPTINTTGTILISEVEENTTITVNTYSVSCNVDTEITTILCEPGAEVATIAQLRAGVLEETYTLTDEVLLTYQQNFRNQKFIEDATAAILIDDPDGIITTTYALGNGISGITGVLSEFNGLMQFLPKNDPGTPSSQGNNIVPQAVSITQLNATPEEYESEFVQIVQGVDINTSENTTWIADEIYELLNPNGIFNFKVAFLEAAYIGLKVPIQNRNIAGIITEENGNYYLTSRNMNDINGVILSNPEAVERRFKLYPNPTNGNYISITSNNPAERLVGIYNLYGQLVLTTKTEDSIDISSLSNGLYFVNIRQDGFTSTEKLLVNH